VDPASLATGLVAVLAPLIPYLAGMGRAAADAAADRGGQALGEAVVERADYLWDRLWPLLRRRSGGQEAVRALSHDIEDEQARSALARELSAILDREPELMRNATELLEAAAGRRVSVKGRDLTVTGDGNVVQQGDQNFNVGSARDVTFDRSS
jgi:hypothetical protein